MPKTLIIAEVCGKINHEVKIMLEILQLFWVFAKIGAVTFGGGLAMLPILQRELVQKLGWSTEDELLDYYAIGQCTPGIIAVNVATFVGYKRKGILGGVASTLGVIFPSVVIITIIAAFIQDFLEYEVVKYAFAGIRVCVVVLIIDAVTTLFKKAVVDLSTAVIFAGAAVVSVFTSVPVAVIVIAAAAMGLSISLIRKRRGGEEK